MAVVFEEADGGIILTASHNPQQWNALKLLNEKGEFLNAEEGAAILECAEKGEFCFADVDSLGTIEEKDFTDAHLDAVLEIAQSFKGSNCLLIFSCLIERHSLLVVRGLTGTKA